MAIINGTFLPDILLGTSDDDTINGFGGLDSLSGGDGHDVIDGGAGDDVLTGGDGNDILIGGTGAATLLSLYNGGTGNDLMIASDLGVAEDFDGGDGIDTVSFAARDSGVTVFLSVIGIPLLDTIENTENVIGSAFDDEITGDGGDNEITGGEGDDVLDGLGGNDTAVYTGNRSDYVASHGSGATIIITDQRSGTTDGEDTTSGIEFYKFADRTYTAAELFAPTLTGVAASTTFSENAINAAPAILDAAVTLSVPESLNGGTLTVTGILAEDVVSIQNVGNLTGEIGFSGGDVRYGGTIIGTAMGGVGGSLTITFNASASAAAAQALIEHLTYRNISDQPTAAHDLTVTLTDGNAGSTNSTITVNVTAQNDAPSITSNGGGSTATVSIEENTTAVTTVMATDPDASATLVYSIVGGADQAHFQINASTGALSFVSPPNYEAPADSDADNGYVVHVKASDGSLSTVQTITVSVTDVSEPTEPTGPTGATPGDDVLTASIGVSKIDALGGIDTVNFNFKLTDATFAWDGTTVTITTADSKITVANTEIFAFADGTVNTNDGNLLVDDLYYYASRHDVWQARVDAEAHYQSNGWREGSDPNAYFDTSFYLALNPDVRASGMNPLEHFATIGAKEGRIPSVSFDPAAYLAANPDVKDAGSNPLLHFLQTGAQEGRQAIPVTEILAPNGFDYVYYLKHNPDVEAAGVDPFQHFQQFGWKEGRDPNAVFDTTGYLEAYGDVKAAGINPLDHYMQFGWKEGRDPSAGFDTGAYLDANQDVASAGTNPLLHYLETGIHEGRSPFADGVFG